MSFTDTLAGVLQALGLVEPQWGTCLVCDHGVEPDDPTFAGEPVHYECVFSVPRETLMDRIA